MFDYRFGINWLNTEGDVTPRLLENLRAEVAGQSGKNCHQLYPLCSDSHHFTSILTKVMQYSVALSASSSHNFRQNFILHKVKLLKLATIFYKFYNKTFYNYYD